MMVHPAGAVLPERDAHEDLSHPGREVERRKRRKSVNVAQRERVTAAIMIVLTLVCHIAPEGMIRIFNTDVAVVAFGAEYLRVISWNFIASGVVFVGGSAFQAMGNTLPPLAASSTRLVLFAVPAVVMSFQPGYQMRQLWYLSVATVSLQMLVNLGLLRREFGRKLNFDAQQNRVGDHGFAIERR
jgi:Na+-driven multidrug efflux pump